jgi:hypothetical protein
MLNLQWTPTADGSLEVTDDGARVFVQNKIEYAQQWYSQIFPAVWISQRRLEFGLYRQWPWFVLGRLPQITGDQIFGHRGELGFGRHRAELNLLFVCRLSPVIANIGDDLGSGNCDSQLSMPVKILQSQVDHLAEEQIRRGGSF